MMSSFTLTNMAKADLKRIGHYTLEKWGREQRNHYLSVRVLHGRMDLETQLSAS